MRQKYWRTQEIGPTSVCHQVGPMTLAKRDYDITPRAKAMLSQHLSQRLPCYLTPDEVHKLLRVTGSERDRLLLELLWETGSESARPSGLGWTTSAITESGFGAKAAGNGWSSCRMA